MSTRPLPVPGARVGTIERLGAVALAAGVAGAVWPGLADATGATLPCPLRATTGVPCPLCGMTTATVALVRGRVGEAMAANPLVLVLPAFVVLAAVALLRRRRGVAAHPASARQLRTATIAAAVAIGLAWLWQLDRFAFV